MSGDPLLERLAVAKATEYFAKRDKFIMVAWQRGYDTSLIAKHLKIHESIVANRLAQLRDAKFDEREIPRRL